MVDVEEDVIFSTGAPLGGAWCDSEQLKATGATGGVR